MNKPMYTIRIQKDGEEEKVMRTENLILLTFEHGTWQERMVDAEAGMVEEAIIELQADMHEMREAFFERTLH